jgi:hypothetical protein
MKNAAVGTTDGSIHGPGELCAAYTYIDRCCIDRLDKFVAPPARNCLTNKDPSQVPRAHLELILFTY